MPIPSDADQAAAGVAPHLTANTSPPAPAETAEGSLPAGPHRIANAGESISGGAYAFECSRCGNRAPYADFVYGRVTCTDEAEDEWSRERAENLLNDVTFKGAIAYAVTSPDESGEPTTTTHDRPTTRKALALWMHAEASHHWYRGELRVTCFGTEHIVRPITLPG
ncbi:hypothetical protein [Streptomyces lydicus]|uniref:hypothetical protein n=1 Tax=Streptomyces lydicus TaxID=47763 RepID=UPI00101308B6|nr:hypothetical protein [Streptomyces lydicus]MCZ1012333.1 hypothetical protein [Streptomyces lydicus]